jgi:hypothetical protein
MDHWPLCPGRDTDTRLTAEPDRVARTTRRYHWRKERLLILGDSHADVFRNWRFRFHLPRTTYDRCVVGGATVSGLDNPNSQTQARKIFDRALRSREATAIVTLLGEVDSGFVIWYRAQKHAQSINEMLRLALNNYELLLQQAILQAPVIVISTPLPTIRDGQTWGSVANARRQINASQRMRTELTLAFNRQLEDIAERNGCSFISLDNRCLGPDGLVASEMLGRDTLDHHYSSSEYAKILAPRLADVLASMPAKHTHTLSSRITLDAISRGEQ